MESSSKMDDEDLGEKERIIMSVLFKTMFKISRILPGFNKIMGGILL